MLFLASPEGLHMDKTIAHTTDSWKTLLSGSLAEKETAAKDHHKKTCQFLKTIKELSQNREV